MSESAETAARVRHVWERLAPAFEVVGERNECDVERVRSNLKAEMAITFGAEAIARVALPDDVAAFHALVDRTVISQAFGWWDLELFGRSVHAELVVPDEEAQAGMREHGLWHIVGRFNDKHELWVCVDRSRAEWGHVWDVNDGDPRYPGALVYDRRWDSWLAFLECLTLPAG